ncbi:hypothetical protein [Microbispora sp. NPDC049125]|uniref:hypothetical protein n=1 Tax=Microbispora sp. NPDC049125 TaxID=3154929 RepID=UPI003464F1F6
MRVATVLAGTAVAMLAAGGCSGDKPASPAGGRPASGAAASAVPSQASGDTLALGKVVAGGRPKAGVRVFAVAWPKSAVLDKVKEGDDVPTKVVAQGVTDAGGLFRLTLKPSAIDPLYVEDGGEVQIDLAVDSADGPSWEYTAIQGEKGWSTADGDPGEDHPLEAELEVDPGSGELTVKRLDTAAAAQG